MRAAAAIVLSLLLAAAVGADLGDVDTALGEVAFEAVQVSPDGSRLVFVTLRNDLAGDREVFELWLLDLAGPRAGLPSRSVLLSRTGRYASPRWSPDGRLLSFLSAADGEGPQIHVLEPAAQASPRRVSDPVTFADGVDVYDWLPDGSSPGASAR